MATVKTSPLVSSLRGKLGSAVFVQQPDGVIQLRERVVPRNPRTAAQMAWRDAIRQAGLAYQDLSPAEFLAWKEYAQSLEPQVHRVVNVFIQLSARFMQVNPQGEIPRMPPSSAFDGDKIHVSATESKDGIQFVASDENAKDTMTELLVHKLASAHNRTYLEKYRSQGFVRFGRAESVSLAPGWYACGVRFVRPSTGQMSPIIEIERVKV